MSNSSAYGGQFFNTDEREICSIGTGYIANYVSGGGVSKAGATLTNRRVYFSGAVFTIKNNGEPVLMKQRKVVNTRDITGTGYLLYNPLKALVFAVLAAIFGIIMFSELGGPLGAVFLVVGLVVACGLGVVYYINRKTFIVVEYAGGNLAFDVRWLQPHEQDDFIRNVHLAKDALYSTSAAAQGFVSAASGVKCPHCGEIARSSTGFCRRCGGKM